LPASARGVLLRKVADLIGENARRLAELEVRDNGKLFSEMHGQLSYLPQWYHYYGGLADKVEGTVVPMDRRAISPSPSRCRSVWSASSPLGTPR
jgi:(Z)-2-((N-methylformamido)methylene)-5-hydroxybutyrolactone dehydrogenase